MKTATLILTHENPDLDAIGFVYSARKVFGSTLPVDCRVPTREELEDPAVIVGDVRLPAGQGWGGHPNRIGSPKPAGSLLSRDEVLRLVKAHL